MTSLRLALLVVVVGMATGCKSSSRPASGCPENNDVRGVPLGSGARYHARNVPGAVEIHAVGQNRTAGWTNLLSVSPLRIYPPQFEFHQKPPEGMAGQVLTYYDVCLRHRTEQPFERITIRDVDGAHAVDVAPPGK